MTISVTPGQTVSGPSRWLGWLRRWQQRLSDRIHASGDDFARQAGWTVTPVTGRWGFGRRIYRDPRFDQRRAHAAGRPAVINAGRAAEWRNHDRQHQ